MQFSTTHLVAAVVILLIGVLWQFRGNIINLLKGAGSASITDPDLLDLQAAKRCQARADALKCPEMQAAMQVFMTHFFHTPGHATTSTPVTH